MTEDRPSIASLWNFADPAASEAAFRSALERAEAAGALGFAAELRTQIARTLGLRSRFVEADALLDEVEATLPTAGSVARLRYLLERGRVRNSSGRRAEAGKWFLEAWDLGREIGEHSLAVDAAHMLGICEEPEAALAWSHRAMEYAEQCGDPAARKWLGALYNNTGWTHFDRGELDAALDLLSRGLEWRRDQPDPEPIRIARWSVARLWRALGRVEEALAEQQSLASEYARIERESGYVAEELGECLLALGRDAEARPHFANAHRLLSADNWLVANEPERLMRLAQLAQDAAPMPGNRDSS